MKRTDKARTSAIKGSTATPQYSVSTANVLRAWSAHSAVHLVLIALIGLLAYSNTFHAPFVFDDEGSIVDNPVIKDLSTFLSGAGYAYFPRRFIGYFSFALNYKLGGLDVTSYHVVNIIIHIINAWLVYALVRLTLKTPFFERRNEERGTRNEKNLDLAPRTPYLVPLIAALLFVAHPVQTQAVTYIVQRLASLATMFYLLALVLYIRARLVQEDKEKLSTPPALSLYVLSLMAVLAAMQTKEIAATLPLVVLLFEFSFFGAGARKRLIILIPLLLTIVIIPLGMLQAGKPLGELLSDVSEMARESKVISRGDYLLTQFSVIVTYLRLLFLPVNQNLDYDYPLYHSLFTPRVLLSFILLCAILGGAVWLYRRSHQVKMQNANCKVQNEDQKINFEFCILQFALCIPKAGAMRLAAFGILWFFITLSVESSVVPISDVIFEHRIYLPSVGAACAAAAIFALVALRLSPKACILAGGAVIMTLAAITWQRNVVWGSSVSLWQDCVSKSPEKVRPYNNLANSLTAQGRFDEAIEQLRAALKLEPNNANALRNLGAAYEKKGWLDEAAKLYKMALAVMPGDPFAHYNLGVTYASKGLTDLAIEQFLTAITLNPRYADAHNNLGSAYGTKEMIDEAIDQFQQAVRLNPGSAEAHSNLGFAYGKKGMTEKAIEELATAINLQPGYAEAYNNLGIIYGLQGDFDQSAEQFQKAISLQPNNPKYSDNLANLYRQK